jgi:hypothetical protein
VVRPLVAALFLLTGQAVAGECGSRLDAAEAEQLTREVQRGAAALAAYGESLPSRPDANSVQQLVLQLVLLQERLDRAGQLAEIRDAMRHGGEKSFVQFKLSHEASQLKLVSSRARRDVEDFLLSPQGVSGDGPAKLREALQRAQLLFAACDSPM